VSWPVGHGECIPESAGDTLLWLAFPSANAYIRGHGVTNDGRSVLSDTSKGKSGVLSGVSRQ
jgi:hypothetical protein